jgi:hypothetical protein
MTAPIQGRWQIGADTRRVVIFRLIVGALVGLPGCLEAFIWMGGGSLWAVLIALPPACLGWMWLVDAVSLLRSGSSPPAYKRRPWFLAVVMIALVPMIFWAGWLAALRRN